MQNLERAIIDALGKYHNMQYWYSLGVVVLSHKTAAWALE